MQGAAAIKQHIVVRFDQRIDGVAAFQRVANQSARLHVLDCQSSQFARTQAEGVREENHAVIAHRLAACGFEHSVQFLVRPEFDVHVALTLR